MAGNGMVTIMLLMLFLLVVGKADSFASLSFKDPPITTHQAPAPSPNPITIPSTPTSPHPINTPPIPTTPQAPAAPLPINTPSAFPSLIPIDTPIVFPSSIPIDTPIAAPSPFHINIPIIPRFPIPDIGISIPSNLRCALMCSRSCSLHIRNRFAYVKCMGLCHLGCTRGISDITNDCTNNCLESKFPDYNLAHVADVVNHVSSCYAGCKKNI